jgi:CubicO group peptidase (beta-lactamase class C family)
MTHRRVVPVSLVLVLMVLQLWSCRGSSFVYEEPVDLGDGWPTAELSEVGLDAQPFIELIDEISAADERAVHGILVVKDGRLVLEEYFDGYRFDYDDPQFRGDRVEYDALTRQNLMSVTKAVTGALVGIAIDEGHVAGVDESVVAYFDQYDGLSPGEKDKITVEHLLTMTSGLEWNEWDVPLTDADNNDLIQLFIVDDPIEYILAKPLEHEPGTYWYYSGGDVNLLGEIFKRSTGTSIDEYAQTHLFEPLGITDYQWRYLNTDVVYAAGELELRPRDLAKFGWLYLSDGRWNGTKVISSTWIENSIREHVSIPGRSADGDGYGYQWFTQRYEHNGQTIDAAIRTGWGGQAVVVFPSLDTMVVLTGGDYVLQTQVSELVSRHVVPAIDQSG